MNVVDWLADFKLKKTDHNPSSSSRSQSEHSSRKKLAFYSSLSLMNDVDWLAGPFSSSQRPRSTNCRDEIEPDPKRMRRYQSYEN